MCSLILYKYLKYKNKYLELQKYDNMLQLGGANLSIEGCKCCENDENQASAVFICGCIGHAHKKLEPILDLQQSKKSAFSYCKCKKCAKVAEYSKQNIWFHRGTGILSNSDFAALKYGIVDSKVLFEIPRNTTEFGKGEKPKGALWFSSGSWFFDFDGSSIDEHKDPERDEYFDYTIKCAMVNKPKKIYEIHNFIELNTFVDTYCLKKISEEAIKHEREMNLYCRYNLKFAVDSINKEKNKDKYQDIDFQQIKELICKQFELDRQQKIKNSTYLDIVKYIISEYNGDITLAFAKYTPTYNDKATMEDLNLTLYEQQIYELLIILRDKIICEYLANLPKPDEYEPDYSGIDWDKIYSDGFWGVAFNFRKVKHISRKDINYDKFRWHRGYDVESLIIFDHRALQDCLSIVNIDILTLDILQ